MKNVVRRAAAELLWRTRLSELARLAFGSGRFVLEFHGVARKRYDELPPAAQPSFCREGLRAVLGWLRGRFDFLTPEDLFSGRRRGVLLTFDDGYANHLTNALPVLEEHGAPAVFFVTTRHVADPGDWLPAIRQAAAECAAELPAAVRRDLFDGMSVDEARAAAASPLVTVGSHTVNHPFLTRCNDAALALELGESKSYLEDVTGRPVELFAYPAGDYDHRVTAAVRAAGYRAAFVEGSRRPGGGRWEIPRVGLYSAAPAYLSAKLSGLAERPLRRRQLAAWFD